MIEYVFSCGKGLSVSDAWQLEIVKEFIINKKRIVNVSKCLFNINRFFICFKFSLPFVLFYLLPTIIIEENQ